MIYFQMQKDINPWEIEKMFNVLTSIDSDASILALEIISDINVWKAYLYFEDDDCILMK